MAFLFKDYRIRLYRGRSDRRVLRNGQDMGLHLLRCRGNQRYYFVSVEYIVIYGSLGDIIDIKRHFDAFPVSGGKAVSFGFTGKPETC